METSELKKVLSFLEERRSTFISEWNEFSEHPLIYGFSADAFHLSLTLLKEEIIQNLSFESHNDLVTYYEAIISALEKDNFAKSFRDLKPQKLGCENRSEFLNGFYSAFPDDGSGDGEAEFTLACFRDFLYNYQSTIDEIVSTISQLLTDYKRKNYKDDSVHLNYPAKKKRTDEEIEAVIKKVVEHLSGVNNSQEQIMAESEFMRLLDALFDLAKNGTYDEVKPFELRGISAQSIIYTLYQIHVRLNDGTKINVDYIHFLKKCFPILVKYEHSTIKSKFSVPPKKYPF